MNTLRWHLIIAAFLAFATRGFAQCVGAHCSAVIPTTTATGSITSANLGSTSMRLEVRLHGQNWSATNNVNPILNFGGLSISYLGNTAGPHVLFFGGPDPSSTGYGNCLITIGSPADVTIGINRDVPNMQLRVYVTNAQTGAAIGLPCHYTLSSLASGATIQSNAIALGKALADGNLAFVHWFSGVVADGAAIPIALSTPADIGNWEFENNGNDTSGHSQTITGIGGYAGTPIYAPACRAGVPQTSNVGGTMLLNGSGSSPRDGGTTLTYSWAYAVGSDGVNQAATFSNSAVVNPTVSHLLTFGSANFTLTVTDGSAQQTACTVHNGVVPFDANGVVDMAAQGRTAAQIKIAGPLIAYGQNPWPWADNRDLAELTLQTANLASSYTQYWKVFAGGSISFTGGSATVTGTGTSFKSLFCGGGTTPVNTPWIIWRYTGTDSITHYTQMPVTACADDTHITISAVYPASPAAPWPACSPCSGLSYRGKDDTTPASGTWAFNSAPGNYYDNLEAALTGYWRSGFDTYYDFKELMAADWLEIPTNDYFFNCAALTPLPPGYVCQPGPARGISATGIILYQQDGHPELLPGLRKIWETADFQLNTYLPFSLLRFDQREFAYWLAFESMCVLIETGTPQTSCRTSVTNALSLFTSLQESGSGAFPQFYATKTSVTADPFNGGGTCAVTIGSSSVVCSGTSFTSGDVNTMFITWTGTAGSAPPKNNSTLDPIQYSITAVNAGTQTLTLNTTYAGATASGKGYASSASLLAWGVQPFMQGHLGLAFYYAGEATTGSTQTTYRSYMNAAAQVVINSIVPTSGGIFYGAYHPGCTPPFTYTTLTQFCWGTDTFNSGAYSPSQLRTLATEGMRALARSYLFSGSPTVKTAGDLLMSQMFSKPGTGGPNPDGFYLSDYDDGGFFLIGTPPAGKGPKWYGELCGYTGACSVWPAARVTAVQSTGTIVRGLVSVRGAGTIQ